MQMIFHHPQATEDHWGLIPSFLSEANPASAKEQFDKNYISGWRPMARFRKDSDDTLHYPGDPALRPISEIKFRDERILLYQHEVVAIIQPDGSFEACRMD